MKNKIRIGILVNSLQLEVWKDEIINEIEASTYAEVVLFVKRNEPNSLSKGRKIWKYRRSIVYKLIEKLDAFLSKKLTKKLIDYILFHESAVPCNVKKKSD